MGLLVLRVETIISAKAVNTGQQIYSAGLVIGMLHYIGIGAHTMAIILACLRRQLELLKLLMGSGPKQCPPKRGDNKKPKPN